MRSACRARSIDGFKELLIPFQVMASIWNVLTEKNASDDLGRMGTPAATSVYNWGQPTSVVPTACKLATRAPMLGLHR